MKIGVHTWGTEGDVRPFFALAAELSSRGHDVRVGYTNVEGRDFSGLAKACGVVADSVATDYFTARKEYLDALSDELFGGMNALRQMRVLIDELLVPVVDRMFEAARQSAEDCDVLVGHFMAYPAGAAARLRGRPFVAVSMQPIFPSKHCPPPGLPDLGRLLNPLSWRLAGQVLESALRKPVNDLRLRCGFPPIKNLLYSALDEIDLALVALSPSLFKRPPDWRAHAEIPGFFSLEETQTGWVPDAPLEAFLRAGEPPVFLSFGSMFSIGSKGTRESVSTLAESVKLCGVRGIIQAPAELAADAPRGPDLFYLERAPHKALFPRCSAVVHHGGAGTTQTSLGAGLPQVIVPHATDQFYFAQIVHEQGASTKPLPRGKLSRERLAARLREALSSPSIRANAKRLAASMGKENGARTAAEMIEALMASRGKR